MCLPIHAYTVVSICTCVRALYVHISIYVRAFLSIYICAHIHIDRQFMYLCNYTCVCRNYFWIYVCAHIHLRIQGNCERDSFARGWHDFLFQNSPTREGNLWRRKLCKCPAKKYLSRRPFPGGKSLTIVLTVPTRKLVTPSPKPHTRTSKPHGPKTLNLDTTS